jgi:hypothetical protein
VFAFLEEASSAMSDWVFRFLDGSVFGLLRLNVKRMPRRHPVSRHDLSSADVPRRAPRVLKECLLQVFSSMDMKPHKLAVKDNLLVRRGRDASDGGEDASLLCQAAYALRAKDIDSTLL